MLLSFNTDINSLRLARNLGEISNPTKDIMQRLSTGVRINSAKDDAANLALSKKLQAAYSGLDVANNNISTSLSQLQTFEGYLSGINDALQKVRTLATQASNGIYAENEQNIIDQNAKQIMRDLDRAAQSANAEIGAKDINNFGFTNEVKQIDEASALNAGYNESHIIKSAAEFVSKISADLSGDFILTKDIDLSELGTLDKSVITGTFQGSLDGNGHNLKNLNIDTASASVDYVGVFAQLQGAEIKNVGIVDSSVIAKESNSVGIMSGATSSGTKITNCYTEGSVHGKYYTGGMVGRNRSSSTITDSYANVQAQTEVYWVGGLAGSNQNGAVISNCYSLGNILGGDVAGGLVAAQDFTGIIKDSFSSMDINAGGWNGGLVGDNSGASKIENCFATGDIKGNIIVGGLVGYQAENSSIKNSYATGDVNANDYTGGLVGVTLEGSVSGSYATGSVTGANEVGGLIGNMEDSGTVTNSYATGDVKGNDFVGGFVGRTEDTASVKNSYTTSKTTGNSNVGGFVGGLTAGTVDDTNFYNNNLTTDSAGSTATTDAQSAMTNWDSTLWDTTSTTPDLIWDQKQNIVSIQTGADNDMDSRYDLKYLGINFNEKGGINFDLSSPQNAREAMTIIDNALTYLNDKRAQVGSSIVALEAKTQSNSNRYQNLVNGNSIIRDTDIAKESANLTRNQILQQASASLLQQSQQLNSQLLLGLIQ